MPDNPAQTLRQAAKKLRSTASTATAGPWRVHEANGFLRVDNDRGHASADLAEWNRDTAEWIALMHPGVGLALADWLGATASEMTTVDGTEYQAYGDGHDFASWNAALAVARQVLGEVTE